MPVRRLRHRAALYIATFVLALAGWVSGVAAQNAPDPSYCDSKLGRNYDRQPAEEKSARLMAYFNCRLHQDSNYLKARRKAILTALQDWKSRAHRVVSTSISTKASLARAELAAVHKKERLKLRSNYEEQYAAINAAATPENHYESNRKRHDVTVKLRKAEAEQFKRHASEARGLRQALNRCQVETASQIRDMFSSDVQSIESQYLDKSQSLRAEYEILKSTPLNMSIADYESQQRQAPTAEAGSSSESPFGALNESEGPVTVTRSSGETVEGTAGTPIYEGDVVETGESGRCEIVFMDESSLALFGNAKLEIDEYVYDPAPPDPKGKTSLLRRLFLFTSGLIKRKEPSDVDIEPVLGGTGIRY